MDADLGGLCGRSLDERLHGAPLYSCEFLREAASSFQVGRFVEGERGGNWSRTLGAGSAGAGGGALSTSNIASPFFMRSFAISHAHGGTCGLSSLSLSFSATNPVSFAVKASSVESAPQHSIAQNIRASLFRRSYAFAAES